MRLRAFLPLVAALLVGCGGAAQTAAPTSAPAAQPAASPQPTAGPDSAEVSPTAPPTTAPASAQASAPTTAPAPTAAPAAPEELSLGLELVADGFARPTQVTSAGDGSGRLFVVEQAGRILLLRDGAALPDPFLDIIPLVGANGNEQGLLSVAFHPQFAENGLLFVNYTDRAGDTVVARYSVDPANPDRADAASARVLLQIEQPAPNHNGGLLKFGPDGYLYIGTGDGGAAGDPWGSGQSLNTMLGKLLRIDVDNGEPYAVPPDNPFVGQEGVRPEIWAYGLRNPWRFAFDRATGDLFIADVGQNEQEEINFQPAASPGGENYGWNTMEGDRCFRAQNCDQASLQLPVAVYPHGGAEGGCSVTGGYVYRGEAFPQLAGTYVYTDYCTGNLWTLRDTGGQWEQALVGQLSIRTSSFGEDEAGELYLADGGDGGIYRLVVE